MLKRWWNYLKTLISGGVEARMDPAVQIEQMIGDARRQDQELRTQAARVIAHRNEVQLKLDRAVEDAAKAKAQAGQALRNADAATQKGDAAEAEKWTNLAQSLAMKLQSSESMVESLKQQYGAASQQSDLAKREVDQNALRLEQLSAKRMELLGKLEQAKMQEQVNQTLQQISRPMEQSGPTVDEIEDKINRRMAQASATGELESASIAGAQREMHGAIESIELFWPIERQSRDAVGCVDEYGRVRHVVSPVAAAR